MYSRHCIDKNGQPLPLDTSAVSMREILPVNTHGGLLSFGAPWETPAMYNIIEAVEQLNGTAHGRQVKDAKRALVYGLTPSPLPIPILC
jgi:acetyl-CoA acetyltransferase